MARILRGLWRRGGPGDLAAIEDLARCHPAAPAFAEVGEGLRPRCHPGPEDVRQAVALVRDGYWNGPFSDEVLAGAVGSSAWVGLQGEGGLVATARAISDGHKRAWIYDVAVADERRGQGLGTVLMGLILDHPRVRDVDQVCLTTRDAMPFYARHGFREARTDTSGPYPRTDMVRDR